MSSRDARLGWKPEVPDQRDHQFDHVKVLQRYRNLLPDTVDLRTLGYHTPNIRQGNLGSCVAHTVAKAYEFAQRKQGLADYIPSRLALYYWAREMEGTIHSDAGCYIRDAFKAVNTIGAPHERLWPYDPRRFTVLPPATTRRDASLHQALAYQSVNVSTVAVKAAIAAGHPVAVGFTVYNSFYDIGKDGFMPVPKAGERVEGGHAVLCLGYQKMQAPWDRSHVDYGIFMNWWDDDETHFWGDKGFFYARLNWMCSTKNADDFWTLTEVEA